MDLKKFRAWKSFGSKKKLCPKENFGSTKFWAWKKFRPEKIFDPKTIMWGPKKNLGLKFFCCSCYSCDMDPSPPKLSQKPMSSLCVKFQPSSTPPSDRFLWGVIFLVLVHVLVTGVKQSQLLVLRLSLEFDKKKKLFAWLTDTLLIFLANRNMAVFWVYSTFRQGVFSCSS